jgi:hypothetical protein
MNIECKTLFDCSATGTTGHYKPGSVPYLDKVGQSIEDLISWSNSRNRQRNWETLLQIVQLRSQIEIVSEPEIRESTWTFVFSVENDHVYGEQFLELYHDSRGVPMLTALSETKTKDSMLIIQGANQNIWFRKINN